MGVPQQGRILLLVIKMKGALPCISATTETLNVDHRCVYPKYHMDLGPPLNRNREEACEEEHEEKSCAYSAGLPTISSLSS
jgi:hypothetical protein